MNNIDEKDMLEKDKSEILSVVKTIATQAGEIFLSGFGKKQDIEFKGEIDLVTEYDYLVEKFIVSEIKKNYPEHRIYSEELGEVKRNSKYLWLLDPIDGTTNYAHGFPAAAISIALVLDNQPILGVVLDPLRNELYVAEIHKGANLNGEKICVTKENQLNNSLIATGFPYDVRTKSDNNLSRFYRLIKLVRGLRYTGSATLNCVWVAAGRLDGYWEYGTKPWDTAAGALIVREAGGKVTTIENKDNFLNKESIVVTNKNIHNQLLSVLSAK